MPDNKSRDQPLISRSISFTCFGVSVRFSYPSSVMSTLSATASAHTPLQNLAMHTFYPYAPDLPIPLQYVLVNVICVLRIL